MEYQGNRAALYERYRGWSQNQTDGGGIEGDGVMADEWLQEGMG